MEAVAAGAPRRTAAVVAGTGVGAGMGTARCAARAGATSGTAEGTPTAEREATGRVESKAFDGALEGDTAIAQGGCL
jgi:hypothetical protein